MIGEDGTRHLTISRAVTGKTAALPIRGTKTRRSRVVSVSVVLQSWLDRFGPHVCGASAGSFR
jgi:hypothetical protein